MSTISSTITTEITLGTAGNYASPLTITATGAVEASGIAVYGPVTSAWTVVNQGTIAQSGSGGLGFGVYLRAGGLVSNASGALISGTNEGVRIGSAGGTAGTVVNLGTIVGGVDIAGAGVAVNGTAGGPVYLISGGVTVGGTGSIGNYGSIAGSVYLGGGSLTNGSSGAGRSITGTGLGVEIGLQSAGTLNNFGTIAESGSGGLGFGVYLRAGGLVSNASGALISGTNEGVRIGSAGGTAGTVVNLGTIVGGVDIAGAGVAVNGTAGGPVYLISGGVTVGGTGSIGNYGSIAGSVYLGGGSLTNGSSGAGRSITGTGLGVEIGLQSAGTLNNFGTIAQSGSGGLGFGVYLRAGGLVSNASGALISGTNEGVRIGSAGGTAGTVVNLGTITGGVDIAGAGVAVNGTAGGPVYLISGGVTVGGTGSIGNYGSIAGSVYLGGGSLTNGSSGAGRSITGTGLGVEIGLQSAGTLNNFGTIAQSGSGGLGFGVYLRAGGLVSNASGALISGTNEGVRIGSAGGTAGTVVNLGTIVGGVDIAGAGVAVNGTAGGPVYLISGGVTVGGTGSIGNYGSIAGSVYLGGGSLTNGSSGAGRSITGTGLGVEIGLQSAGTLNNFGTIAESGSGGLGFGVYLRAGGLVSNASGALISGTNEGVRIGNAGGTAGTVVNLGTILGGVDIAGAGVAVNGTAGGSVYLISGGVTVGGTGSIGNYGSIAGSVYLGGGSLTNGSSGAGRSITGTGLGVEIGLQSAGTLNNFGTIAESGSGGLGFGVYLRAGGLVSNASGALISGTNEGVRIGNAGGTAGTVVNLGTILGGVDIAGAGVAVNGTAGGSVYLISGGVTVGGTGSIGNYGSIAGSVYLGGGSLTNGSSSAGRSITGTGLGVEIGLQSAGTLNNFGTIAQSGSGGLGFGVYLRAGGLVSNASGALISGTNEGVRIGNAGGTAGTVVNLGTILGGVHIIRGVGINYGTITAVTNGVGIAVLSGTATNFGTIIAPGTAAKAVVIQYGTFFNQGVLEGAAYGIELGLAGTPTGTATVGGQVTAAGTVRGATGIGVAQGVTASYTLTVAGIVTGTSGTAVSLTPGGDNRLIVDPGAAFTGVVDGGGGGSVLEIAGLSGASSGGAGVVAAPSAAAYVSLGSVTNFSALEIDPSATFGGVGVLSFATLVNQGQINVGAGNSLALGVVVSAANAGVIDLQSGGTITFHGSVGNQTLLFQPPGGTALIDHPEAFLGTLSGFTTALDIVDLTTLNPVGASATLDAVSDRLVVTSGTQSVSLQLATGVDYTGITWQTSSDGGTGTDVAPVCFCRGTLIQTDRGEVPVEALAVGDRVVTLSGAARPIRWIGFGRDLVTRRHSLARPIVVRRGALADDVPRRDLHLTHGHALYLGGVLVPVENLVNHRTILWDEAARVVEYYHIELDDHDVLFAEGAPAESYYDAANRALFHNTRPGSEPGAGTPTYAPVETGGAAVERVWAQLYARAGGQITREATDDPDLHLVIDGARRDPVSGDDGVYIFALAAPPTGPLRLCSRSAVPSLAGTNRHDHRRLGVALRRIILCGPGLMTALDHDAPLFAQGGCHPPEPGHSWTDGELTLPAALFTHLTGAFTLLVHTSKQAIRYPVAGAVAA